MASFVSTGGYTELRASVADDIALTVTLGTSLSGATLVGNLFAPGTTTPVPGAVTVTVTGAPTGTFTVAVTGQTLLVTAYPYPYEYEVLRTDAGNRAVLVWGPLNTFDPSQQPTS